jgi:hypothetical protein
MSTTASVLSAQFYIRAIRPFSVLGICTYICESSFELTYSRSQFFGTCKLASGLSQARLHMPRGSVWDPGVRDTISWATEIKG